MEEVVAQGIWLYGGTVPSPILIVRLDYDFWHMIGEANGDLQQDDQPRLNADGHLYYLRFRPGWSGGSAFWPDGIGYASLAEAIAAAAYQVPTPITWQD